MSRGKLWNISPKLRSPIQDSESMALTNASTEDGTMGTTSDC